MTLVHHVLGFVRAVLRASFPTFHRWIEQGSLWRILRAGLRVLAVTVAAIVVMLAAEIAGAFVDQAAVSQTAVAAAKSLAVRVIPFLPHSNEGGRLLVGGNLFIESGEDGLWPGFARARIFERAKWDFYQVRVPNPPWMRGIFDWKQSSRLHQRTPTGWTNVMNGRYLGTQPVREIGFPVSFMPPLSYHILATLAAMVIWGAGAWVARQEHRVRALCRACRVGLVLALLTLPAAFAAWSGPQIVRQFWEQVYGLSEPGSVIAWDRVWVQPALGETAGILFFGIVYAFCLFAAAWRATNYLQGVGDRTRGTSVRRVMGREGVASCLRCGYQLGNLPACPECGQAHGDLPHRVWPWNSRWFRTQRARRVALCLLVGTAAIASAALPLLAGVAEVLFKRL